MLSALGEAIRKFRGLPDKVKGDDMPAVVGAFPYPMQLEVGATTVRTSATVTENVATNDHVRIWGSDGKAYTLAEWNAMFAEAGFDKDNMPVTPKGFAVTKRNGSVEGISWSDFFDGNTWQLAGGAARGQYNLQHSPYNTLSDITAAASGTDAVTNKEWSITDDGDEWVLSTANTGATFRVPKGIPYVNALGDSDNFEERTESLYQITEWYRHRFAIESGLTTNQADGAMTTVEILNASGEQAAANEDMYFWIGGVNTGKLAKYNMNNLHNGNATSSFTETIQTNVYNAQKAAGIDMNDTGVNSSSKPTLCPGAKGAEAIAKDGKWLIITPYVTYAANAGMFGDAPSVYFVRNSGLSLPSQEALEMWYWNMTLVNALRTYLNSKEGRSLPTAAASAYWSSARTSDTAAWYVTTSNGSRGSNSTRYNGRVVGASGL